MCNITLGERTLILIVLLCIMILLLTHIAELQLSKILDEYFDGNHLSEDHVHDFSAPLIQRSDEEIFICNTSPISPHWSLTTAHCLILIDAEEFAHPDAVWYIKYGESEISELDFYIIHSSYDNVTLDNNIGLVRVVDHFKIGEFIKISNYDINDYFRMEHSLIYSAGYGKLSYESDPSEYYFIIVIKKYKNNADYSRLTQFCNPDSGASLISNNFLIGINSHGEKCNSDDEQIYVNVYEYRKWINDIIATDQIGN